ncbi:ImmA/IrrE family metallo-endopeptidase [Ignavigranum ruoffiae]|uniref:ImmA/IrrE family metallo-endopeptidase n=1 Tax=Ignavigranum ruoffiae TaxID=89093 RepID=UPI002355B976|nr:ImmA/IrrE family metallo-endopeptidase [Ignavigranum ruoffiae]
MIEKEIEKVYKSCESFDPYIISKNKRIDILKYPLDLETCGLSVRNNRYSTIIINDNIDENLQEFTLCHELGHSVLHKNINTPFMRTTGAPSSVSKIESEAHQFAFKLLRFHYEELQYMTKEDILNYYSLPLWMERFL